MILLIDNFDSFTYNLYHFVAGSPVLQQYARQHHAERAESVPAVQVVRNDAVTLADIRRRNPQAIILSPGPGRPENAGICPAIMRELTGDYPILGVCLGHQALCQAFGATITYAANSSTAKLAPSPSTPPTSSSADCRSVSWWAATIPLSQTPPPCWRSCVLPPALTTAKLWPSRT